MTELHRDTPTMTDPAPFLDEHREHDTYDPRALFDDHLAAHEHPNGFMQCDEAAVLYRRLPEDEQVAVDSLTDQSDSLTQGQ